MMESIAENDVFQLRKSSTCRTSLSLKMRKNMIENDVTSSPSFIKLQTHRRIIREEEERNHLDIKENIDGDRIKSAVERLSDSEQLIGDGSRCYTLPTVCGKHKDLKSISPQTVEDVLKGIYGENYKILDCRYPYEYNGGHIQGAENTYTKEDIDSILNIPEKDRPIFLIFHCEFSSQRAPRLLRHLRSQDRLLNCQNYPALNYPEVYILDGGYKAFYEHNVELCEPSSYVPMLHEDYSKELHHYRMITKSDTEREKTADKKRHRSRLIRF